MDEEKEYIAKYKVGYRKGELDGLVAYDTHQAHKMAKRILERKYPNRKVSIILVCAKELIIKCLDL